MEARGIDPRDAVWEVDDPTYRVYFWADDGSGKEEWELSKADLDEVLQWIPSQSRGRSHSLWAVTRLAPSDDVCLIRLRGIDLDSTPGTWPGWAGQVYR
jgi:hypothetical protein